MKKYTKDEILSIVIEANQAMTKLIKESNDAKEDKDDMLGFFMQAKDIALLAAFSTEITKRLEEK